MSKLDKIEELQNLLHDDSQNFQARRQLAVLLTDCGFNEEALKNLIYLTKVFKNDSGVFYNLGIVYEKLKNFPKAKEAYMKALEIEPDAIDAIYNLGLVCTELGEYEHAIQCFEYVISSDEKDSNSYFNLGLVYFKMKDYPQALEFFQKTIDLNDEDIYAHFYIGNIMKELGDNDGARSEFYKVLDISPEYSWAYYNLAVIDYENGNLQSALEKLSKTTELNPYDIEAYKVMSKIYAIKEDWANAEEILLQAIDNCGENGDIYYMLGKVAEKYGDNDKYKNYLNEALRNNQTLSIPITTVKIEMNKIK